MNFFKRIFSGWGNKTEYVDREVYQLEEDLVRKDTLINAMPKEKQSLTAQLSNQEAEKRKVRDLENDGLARQEQISELKTQVRNKKAQDFEGAVSLRTLFKVMEKNPRFIPEMMDRDMERSLARLGDIVFLNNKDIALVDTQGDIVSRGKQLSHIIHKPGGFINQLAKGIIRLPCDKDFNANPDLEEEEVPVHTFNPKTGKMKWAVVKHSELGKQVKDMNQRLADADQYTAVLEQTKSEMATKIKGVIRDNHILDSKNKTAEVELSRLTIQHKQMNEKFGNLKRRTAQLQIMESLGKEMQTRLKNINKELMERVEQLGMKTDFERVLAELKDIVDWSTQNFQPKPEVVSLPKQPPQQQPPLPPPR